MSSEELESLRSKWSTLYSQTLPSLARSKDPVQSKWPVTLDHCFARIILDNTVGEGKSQWDHVINKPAVRNMDKTQLEAAIHLGEKIQKGQADLVELDKKSLQARGKGEKKYKNARKHDREEADDADKLELTSKRSKTSAKDKQSTLPFSSSVNKDHMQSSPSTKDSSVDVSITNSEASSLPNPNTPQLLLKIKNHAGLTPYRKRLYSTLLSVPPGSYTTYQAIATYLDSSARAVGNGMRNNPWAPDTPCHRVLASDGTIGGFGGSWGEEGKHAGKKRALLKSEGVHFDSRGKVKGPVFRDLEDLSQRNIG